NRVDLGRLFLREVLPDEVLHRLTALKCCDGRCDRCNVLSEPVARQRQIVRLLPAVAPQVERVLDSVRAGRLLMRVTHGQPRSALHAILARIAAKCSSAEGWTLRIRRIAPFSGSRRWSHQPSRFGTISPGQAGSSALSWASLPVV